VTVVLPLEADAERVLTERRPLIDLRAPGEFTRGAIPGAVNLPLLTDRERAAVGTCYKREGQAAAIALGESLVSGAVRQERLEAWLAFVQPRPDALLYCWRGGLRSQRVQQWLAESGAVVPRIEGGYKALRRTCLAAIERAAQQQRLVVIGGRTGSGKTALLRELDAAIDLEALANHRGSAFGAEATPQPTPIDFENALAVALLRLKARPVLVVEDEGRTIGRIGLPEALHAAMQRAPVYVIEDSRATRARRILNDYVTEPRRKGAADSTLRQRYLEAVDRIRRRLGGLRHAAVRAEIEVAFDGRDDAAHLSWIEHLLEWYYDPMYDHQLAGKADRIVERGAKDTVAGALRRALG